MIRTRALTKRFGSVTAVDGVDLDVRPGDIYGFLGPNGSGKTTTVRLLLGLVLPTSGEIEVLGERMPRRAGRVLPRVGAIVEAPAAYGHLPGRANLALFDAAGAGGSRRTRRRRIATALEQVGLGGVDERPVKAYSLGMRQRLGLAAALLRQPELLVLDEPTNGLDPQGIHEIRDLLLALNRAGTTVFLSSHLLAEVEQMCDRVGVLDRGRLVLQDDLAALRAPTGNVLLRTPDLAAAAALLDGQVVAGPLARQDPDRLVVRADDPAELNARLVAAGVRVRELGVERRTLEQVVLAATSAGSDRIDGPPAPVTGRPAIAAGAPALAPPGAAQAELPGPGAEPPGPKAEPPGPKAEPPGPKAEPPGPEAESSWSGAEPRAAETEPPRREAG